MFRGARPDFGLVFDPYSAPVRVGHSRGTSAHVDFDASGSFEASPFNTNLVAHWYFGDGGAAAGASTTDVVSHAYGEPGEYTALLAIDNGWRCVYATTTVSVAEAQALRWSKCLPPKFDLATSSASKSRDSSSCRSRADGTCRAGVRPESPIHPTPVWCSRSRTAAASRPPAPS